MGREIKVNKAKPREDRNPGTSGGGNRRSGNYGNPNYTKGGGPR